MAGEALGIRAARGLLIFTTHGEISHSKYMPHIEVGTDGYGFILDSEQQDLSTAEYGHAVTYHTFMSKEVERLPGMQLV